MLFLTSSSQIPYIHLLAKKIGLDKDEYAIATNRDELIHKLTSLKPEEAVYIDVALDWDNNGLAIHHGFVVGADLRRAHGLKNPLFFCGFPSLTYYEKLAKDDPKFHIIFGSGSFYCQHPVSPADLWADVEKAKPLDAATLHDVATMLCNTKGIVNDKLNHRLIFEHGLPSVHSALNEAGQFISAAQKNQINFDYYAGELEKFIQSGSRDGFNKTKDLFLRACTMHLTQEASMEEASSKVRYKILLLDDRQVDLDKYTRLLEKDFTVVRAQQSEEAIRILKEDSSNNIVAVISDWRLYKEESSGYWQQKQGYEVLKYSATTGMRALFALTSQADYVVHQIRNLLGIKFSMFKKENIETQDQWQLFRSILLNSCTETTELMVAVPGGKEKWVKPQRKNQPSYQQEYLQWRNLEEWPVTEAGISKTCDDIWFDYYWKFLNQKEVETLQDFSERFGRPLNTLENVLIGRRICVALFYKQSMFYQVFHDKQRPRANAFSIFRAKLYEEQVAVNRDEFVDVIEKDGKKYSIEEGTMILMEKAATQLLNTELCLDMTNLEKGLFPEEKNWLRRNNITFTLEGHR